MHRQIKGSGAWPQELGEAKLGMGISLPGLTSPCYARGSQSHIKEMLQLVLNWEVSQAAVRTGMICGALWGPKQGQTLQKERTGFLGPSRKDLPEVLSTMALGTWDQLTLEPRLQAWFPKVEEPPYSGLRL